MELKLFKVTILDEWGYRSTHYDYSTSEQSLRKGWEQIGLNEVVGIIVDVEEAEEN